MDIIISANDEVLQMIKEIPIDEIGKVDFNKFKNLVLDIIERKEKKNENNAI